MNNTSNEPKVKGLGCLGFTMFGLPLIIGFSIFILWIFYYAYSSYNKFVVANQTVEKAWSNVENTYQKRYDLIPNLVEVVKGYASHEQETFTAVTEARAKVSSINITADELTEENLAAFEEAQSELSGALIRLLVSVEAYPELKANQHFTQMQNDLKNIENEILIRRDEFNLKVEPYNVLILKFPRNLMAKLFGFKEKAYFKSIEQAKEAPKEKF